MLGLNIQKFRRFAPRDRFGLDLLRGMYYLFTIKDHGVESFFNQAGKGGGKYDISPQVEIICAYFVRHASFANNNSMQLKKTFEGGHKGDAKSLTP